MNCHIPYNVDSRPSSSRSMHRPNGSPISNITDDPTFWVPHGIHRQTSVCQSELPPSDESMPQTPTSPSSSNRSLATLSGNSVPLARSDKHIIFTSTSPGER